MQENAKNETPFSSLKVTGSRLPAGRSDLPSWHPKRATAVALKGAETWDPLDADKCKVSESRDPSHDISMTFHVEPFEEAT